MKKRVPTLPSGGHSETFMLASCLLIFPALLFSPPSHILTLHISLRKPHGLTSLGLCTCPSLCFSGLSAEFWMSFRTYSTHGVHRVGFFETPVLLLHPLGSRSWSVVVDVFCICLPVSSLHSFDHGTQFPMRKSLLPLSAHKVWMGLILLPASQSPGSASWWAAQGCAHDSPRLLRISFSFLLEALRKRLFILAEVAKLADKPSGCLWPMRGNPTQRKEQLG